NFSNSCSKIALSSDKSLNSEILALLFVTKNSWAALFRLAKLIAKDSNFNIAGIRSWIISFVSLLAWLAEKTDVAIIIRIKIIIVKKLASILCKILLNLNLFLNSFILLSFVLFSFSYIISVNLYLN